MKKVKNMTEALEVLRGQKTQPGTPGYHMYNLFGTAHPTVLAVLERHAAQAMLAGQKVAETLTEASKSESGRREINKQINILRSKVASQMDNPTFEEKESKEDLDNKDV